VNSGRRLCGNERAKDVLSPVAQRRRDFAVQSIPEYSTLSGNPLFEALTDNGITPTPDAAAFRLDFRRWPASHGGRNRDIAEDMALGHRTQDLSQKYGVSPGRVSKPRGEFYLDWHRFHGDLGRSPSLPAADRTSPSLRGPSPAPFCLHVTRRSYS
jgi:hypothetical protein